VVLALAVAIPCCWLAVKMRQAEKQRRAVEAIGGADGVVWYDYQRTEGRRHRAVGAEPPAPAWLRRLVGDDLFCDVVCVNFGYRDRVDDVVLEHVKGLTTLKTLDLSYTPITDVGLEHLKGLTNLESLLVSGTRVTDANLEHLKGLTKLKSLGLSFTKVTNDGLMSLKGLRELSYLNLDGTHVTEEGVKELRPALPNCYIHATMTRGRSKGSSY